MILLENLMVFRRLKVNYFIFFEKIGSLIIIFCCVGMVWDFVIVVYF